MDRGRVGVFMGYVEKTPKQYLLWAPDLGRVIKSHAVKFSKNKIGGSIDLKMRKQTANVLPVRNPVGRPRKEPTLLHSEATLTPVIKRTVRFANEPTLTPVKEGPILMPEYELPGINHCESASTLPTGNMGQEPNSTASVAPPAPEPIATKTFSHVAVPRKKAEAQAISPQAVAPQVTADHLKATKFFLHVGIPKRKRSHIDPGEKEISKRLRAMIAVFLADEKNTKAAPINIPVPLTYKEAVGDPFWGEL